MNLNHTKFQYYSYNNMDAIDTLHTLHILHHLIEHEQERADKPEKQIKTQLKYISSLSNVIQSAVNELIDMKENRVIFARRVMQRDYIVQLISQQNQAINYLNHLEYIFPDRKSNRSYYFLQVTIPEP